jgi:hypothetical protein
MLDILLHQNLTSRGAKLLASGLRQSKVTSLRIQMPRRNNRIMNILFEEGIGRSESLQKLGVNGPISNIAALGKAVSLLKVVELFRSELTTLDLHRLGEGLRNTKSLELLEFDTCGLTDQDMRILSSGLLHNSSIKKLLLVENDIGDEGVAAFVENWSNDSPIEEINLSFNKNIGIGGAMTLVEAVPSHRALNSLNLSFTTLGYEGIEIVAERLTHLRLKKFEIVGASGFDHDDDERLDDETRKKAIAAGQAVLRAIQQNDVLQDCCPECNSYPEDLQDEMLLHLELNKCGRYLLRRDNPPSGLWSHVMEFCGRSSIDAIYFFLREQPHLVLSAVNTRAYKKRRRDEDDNEGSMLQRSASRLRRTAVFLGCISTSQRIYEFLLNLRDKEKQEL